MISRITIKLTNIFWAVRGPTSKMRTVRFKELRSDYIVIGMHYNDQSDYDKHCWAEIERYKQATQAGEVAMDYDGDYIFCDLAYLLGLYNTK